MMRTRKREHGQVVDIDIGVDEDSASGGDDCVSFKDHDAQTGRDEATVSHSRAFHRAEEEMDDWTARNPGGFPKQLFFLGGQGEAIITPPADASRTCPLLDLPEEVRERIYLFSVPDDCFAYEFWSCSYWLDMEPPFLIIELDSSMTHLKDLLEAPFLRACRQIRYEALPAILQSTEFALSWLPVLPRFAHFLGDHGCGMVRNLTLWDELDLKSWDTAGYLSLIRELEFFPKLQDLCIFLTSELSDIRSLPLHVTYKDSQGPVQDSVPQQESGETEGENDDSAAVDDSIISMDFSHLDTCWPEYTILERVGAEDFTLCLRFGENELMVFNKGDACTELLKTMRRNAGLDASLDTTSTTAAADLATELPRSDSTIPIYNFVRELLDDEAFGMLPFAARSTGEALDNCALCYLSETHCGYHGMPTSHRDDSARQAFDELNYELMRDFADLAVQSLQTGGQQDVLAKVLVAADYIGWPQERHKSLHDKVDECVDGGYRGVEGDKEGLTMWDTMVRALAKARNESWNG